MGFLGIYSFDDYFVFVGLNCSGLCCMLFVVVVDWLGVLLVLFLVVWFVGLVCLYGFVYCCGY